jgi:hypothetical protein
MGLAFFSKQNTATLPFALLLIEFIFFQKLKFKPIKNYLIIALISTVILLLILFLGFGLEWSDLDTLSRDPQTMGQISRIEYFSTQLVALWHYIYLFFIPLSLHLDYDFPLQPSFFSIAPMMALFAHLIVISLAIRFRYKYPLLLFAILFYYLAQAIESSFFPIFDVFFEHRAYLPNLGLAVFTATIFTLWFEKTRSRLPILAIMILLVYFSYFTIERNQVWNDPITLYQQETQLSPKKERVWAELGKFYLKNKQYNKALTSFGQALNLGRDGNNLNALPTTSKVDPS